MIDNKTMIEKYTIGTFFMQYRVHESTESGYKAKDQSIKRNSFIFKHDWRETPMKDTIIYHGVSSLLNLLFSKFIRRGQLHALNSNID